MSLQTRNPLAVKGATIQSGFLATGEVRINRGGEQVYTSFSGVGTATLIYSGGGRLNSVAVLGSINSGQLTYFFDGTAATSGAPFSTSGHKVVGYIPPVWREGASGVVNPASAPGLVTNWDMPFFSGLYAAPLASGSVGFTCSYTPETSGLGNTQ